MFGYENKKQHQNSTQTNITFENRLLKIEKIANFYILISNCRSLIRFGGIYFGSHVSLSPIQFVNHKIELEFKRKKHFTALD